MCRGLFLVFVTSSFSEDPSESFSFQPKEMSPDQPTCCIISKRFAFSFPKSRASAASEKSRRQPRLSCLLADHIRAIQAPYTMDLLRRCERVGREMPKFPTHWCTYLHFQDLCNNFWYVLRWLRDYQKDEIQLIGFQIELDQLLSFETQTLPTRCSSSGWGGGVAPAQSAGTGKVVWFALFFPRTSCWSFPI